MDLGIKDRVALVAAASKGIVFAAAHELGREGARPEELAAAVAVGVGKSVVHYRHHAPVDGGWVRSLL